MRESKEMFFWILSIMLLIGSLSIMVEVVLAQQPTPNEPVIQCQAVLAIQRHRADQAEQLASDLFLQRNILQKEVEKLRGEVQEKTKQSKEGEDK